MPREREFSSEDVGARKTIIVLCIDTSNSMYTWQKEINNAVKAFINELDNNPKSRYGTEIAVVTYDTTPRLHMSFTGDKTSIKPITIPHNNPSGGWTDMGDALQYAIDTAILQWKKRKSEGVKVYLPWIILFTDGKPENKEKTALEKMEKAISNLQSWETPNQKTDKIHYIGIGVGEDVDMSLMRRISSHGDIRYLHAKNFSMLGDLFKFVGATTVCAGDIRIEYDETSSFRHQPAKNDKPDLSTGDIGAVLQSPTFTTDTYDSHDTFTYATSQQTYDTNEYANEYSASQTQSLLSESVSEESDLDAIDAYFLEVRRRGEKDAGWF